MTSGSHLSDLHTTLSAALDFDHTRLTFFRTTGCQSDSNLPVTDGNIPCFSNFRTLVPRNPRPPRYNRRRRLSPETHDKIVECHKPLGSRRWEYDQTNPISPNRCEINGF